MAPRKKKTDNVAPKSEANAYIAGAGTIVEQQVSETLKANFKASVGQEIEVLLPEPETLKVEPENIPLDILYEDLDVIVVNKPKNMVVHPAAGHYSGTLVNALLYHCKDSLSGINGIMRPGIVHRIDKDTTGALVVCKNDFAHQFVAAQLKEHSITRKYEAIVYQTFKELEGRVEGPIGRHPTERTKMAILMPLRGRLSTVKRCKTCVTLSKMRVLRFLSSSSESLF